MVKLTKNLQNIGIPAIYLDDWKDLNNYSYDNELYQLKEIRKVLSEKYSIIPSMFINDRVLMNIHENKPKTINELWMIDGISEEFIMLYGDEFIKKYNIINSCSL